MSLVWNPNTPDKLLSERSPTTALLWQASRILCKVHWHWDAEKQLWRTHRWSNDSRYEDIREWPAPTAAASLLQAIRGDDRLDDPVIRRLGLYIALEVVTALLREKA